MNLQEQIMHSDYKRMFDSIIENNMGQLQNLEGLDASDDSQDKNKSRKQLERLYNNIRFKIQGGQPLTPAEIMYLGTTTNLSLINLKKRMEYQRLTIEMMERHITPIFKGLTELQDDPDQVTENFYSKVREPLVEPEPKEESNEI